MKTYEEAVIEQQRIVSLLEQPQDYEILTTVAPYYNEDDPSIIEGYYVGVGWHAFIKGKEYGKALAVFDSGTSVLHLRKTLDHNYQSCKADL
jgi:hypothetical protein